MIKQSSIVIITVIIWLCSCSNAGSEPYFLSEPYKVVADVRIKNKPVAKEIKGGEDYNILNAIAIDSLFIFYTPHNPKCFFSVFDMESGENLGEYGIKGRGPLESDYMYPFFDVYQKNNCIMADIVDTSRERLFVWNITRSIEERRSIYDTVQPMLWRKTITTPIAYHARLNDSEFFMCSIPRPVDDINKVITSRSAVRSYEDCSLVREYKIFADSLADFGFEGKWTPLDPFIATYTMNREAKRVAMAMSSYPQINILDLETSELKCVRINNSPIVSVSKNMSFYQNIVSDKDKIYALYIGRDNADLPRTEAEYENYKKNSKYKSMIHVFDWDGNLVDKWQLDKEYNMISLDKNRLYAIRNATGAIDMYEIN